MTDPFINKLFVKTTKIKVISKETDGYKVCNETDTEQKDTWVIPFDVFTDTYKRVK